MKLFFLSLFVFFVTFGYAQEKGTDSTTSYKKRVLESVEVDILTSLYTQDGNNAAVCGGIGTEKLNDIASDIIVAIPLNDDDILTIDAGISAYTSASSSNINPFNGNELADPFVQSSGASSGDVWVNGIFSYSHSSDDRNNIWHVKMSLSSEYDYFSFGFGAGYSKLFNEKNTELDFKFNTFLDTWFPIYPVELRPSGSYNEDDYFNINNHVITGNPDYNPSFSPLNNTKRNSYSVSLGFSQILSKKLQAALSVDFVLQKGLLSTPFQRVYFKDIADSYIENFHLADDIERLPDLRLKIAFGGRLNYYINEIFVLRTYYRYYFDDWGINSHTASIEIPIKIAEKFTLYPSYRFYSQSASDYFAPYNQHLSTEMFYTSDYDLSKFIANQLGFGITYTDIFTKLHIWKFGLKKLDLKFNHYVRSTKLKANILSIGSKFVIN